ILSDDFFSIAGLLAQGECDSHVLHHFERRNTAPAGQTFFRQIRRLKPFGLYLWNGSAFDLLESTHRPIPLQGDAHAYALFKESLRVTLEHELRGRARAGLLFSGGVDSTLLGLVAHSLGREIYAVTAAIEPTGDIFEQDVQRSQWVARQTGWKHDLV